MIKQQMQISLSSSCLTSEIIDKISYELLINDKFISNLNIKLAKEYQIMSKRQIVQEKSYQSTKDQYKNNTKAQLQSLIAQISLILDSLIKQKLQHQLSQLISQNNNILLSIKQSFLQKQSFLPLQQQKLDISFTDVHHLVNEQRRKFQNVQVNDAELQKSISSFVDFKFESIEEKVFHVDKRLKAMQDKYQTNLKSIWNVLSMTQGAVFQFLQKEKEREKQGEKENLVTINQTATKVDKSQKKSTFFKLW